MPQVKIKDITPNGLGVGKLENNKTVFVYGALPGEILNIKIIKEQLKFCFGEPITDKLYNFNPNSIIESNPNRIVPKDLKGYLQTSPFQICTFSYENELKELMVQKAFEMQKIDIQNIEQIATDNIEFEYRNKYTYDFSNDNKLAVTNRLSNELCEVDQISLPKKVIQDYVEGLLKTPNQFVVRSNQQNVVISNFTKQKELTDAINGCEFRYGLDSFFQINIPVFEMALKDIETYLIHNQPKKILDYYCGVGSIGLSILSKLINVQDVVFVEADKSSFKYLLQNIENYKKSLSKNTNEKRGRNYKNLSTKITTKHSTSKKALNYITKDSSLIVDPPRNGLDKETINKIIEVKPNIIIYLSCNPITQARDIKSLENLYTIKFCKPYNFFPRTLHIENLIILASK